MEIKITCCNNINYANLIIDEHKLNIKFAPNGTGKSTISKALIYRNDAVNLNSLMPFKLRGGNAGDLKPKVETSKNIDSIMCFNEDYVSQFTFKPDELLSNSFDILIRNKAYIETEEEIDRIFNKIKNIFSESIELEQLLANLTELSSAFKLSKTGISKSSVGMKALSGGNKIAHIPSGLEVYHPFINSVNNVSWIDWQTKGQREFSSLSDCCPFCSSDTKSIKKQIEKVSKEYDRATIKNLINIITVISTLGEYLSPDAKSKLESITSLPNGIRKEHEQFLSDLKIQIDNFIDKLRKLKDLSGFNFKRNEKVSEKLDELKLDLMFFSVINSEKTRNAVKSINSSIDEVSNQAGILQGKIAIQRSGMQKLIQKHQTDINNFLAFSGYKYQVEISGEDDQSQLKLRHIDYTDFVKGGNQHLSFGERNAFAIVLFMYECIAKKPNLIILDDPISSFDKNKKYAILEMLFRRKSQDCLLGDTVLMLTHDVEPIIDTIKSVSEQFNNTVSAYHLRIDKGTLIEKRITKENIKTFSQICANVISSDKDIIIKLIYLRRSYEILDSKGDAYQVLSNLFHLRDTPLDNRLSNVTGELIEMSATTFNLGCNDINNKILSFNYEEILGRLKNKSELRELYFRCINGYEKLQVFRLFEIDIKSSVIRKFINETYHVENEYICQLDPSEFDLIPEYVTIECDSNLSID